MDLDKEWLISLHGINTDGKWQDDVAPVFRPHFNYQEFRYLEFRRFGVLRLLFGGWWPICFLALASVYIYYASVTWLSIVGVILLWGYLHARSLRSAVAKRLSRFGSIGDNLRPHVIAHSLGTLITGTALQLPHVRTRRIILVAAVLRRTYNWGSLVKSGKVLAVRNEVATNDWVVRSALLLGGLIPPMGHAGLRGFTGENGAVHNVTDPWSDDCLQCSAPIHNITHKGLEHCSLTDTARSQAIAFWLPYLWGINSKQYARFLELCIAAGSPAPSAWKKKYDAQEEILRSRWDWCDEGLQPFVKQQIAFRRKLAQLPKLSFKRMEKLSVRAIVAMVEVVRSAVEQSLSASQVDERGILYLMPTMAVLAAVETLYDDV